MTKDSWKDLGYMIFDFEKIEYVKKKFAWFPMRVDYKWIWLKKVYKIKRCGFVPYYSFNEPKPLNKKELEEVFDVHALLENGLNEISGLNEILRESTKREKSLD